MPSLATLRKKSKSLRQTGSATALNVWIDTPLLKTFEKHCQQTRRTKTAEVEMAIEERLRNAGMWPPKE